MFEFEKDLDDDGGVLWRGRPPSEIYCRALIRLLTNGTS